MRNKNKQIGLVILLLSAVLFTVPLKAQVSIGDQTAPQPFSLLELMTTKVKAGLRLPYVTTAQRDSIALTSTFVSNPLAAGLVIYNTDTNCIEFWDLDQWVSICDCVAPAAPDTIIFSPQSPVVNLNGTFTATAPNVAGMIYTWSLPAGLTGSSTTNSITITGATTGSYDASAITVTVTNSCGATSAATAGAGTICVGVALRNDIPASITIGGNTWSTKNVNDPGTFTANTWDAGMFYQWDRKIGWSSSDPLTSIPSGQTWNSTGSSNTAWDMTNNNPCPTGWRVPTNTELTALVNAGSVWIDACTAVKLGLGQIGGRIFGTTTNPAAYADFNPNSMLFLPAAGYRNSGNSTLSNASTGGDYWSSVQSNALNANCLYFGSLNAYLGGGTKMGGFAIRPVECTAPDAPGAITFSPAPPVVNLNGTFTATVPNVAGMTYTWTLPAGLTGSSTTNSITITGATTGSYDASAITVTVTNSCGATSAATAGSSSTCMDIVVLRSDIPASIALGGYTWSTKNVDAPGTFAANAGDPGMYYQWDSKIAWSSSDPMKSIPAGQTWNTTGSSNTVWDLTNNNPCPSGWSVPTDAALTALNNLGSVWIDSCTVAKLGLGTIGGRIFGTTIAPATYAAFNPNTMLFLPAAGYRSDSSGAQGNVSADGHYWSSVQYNTTNASNLYFLGSNASVVNPSKAYGLSVRCVAQ